MSLEGLPIEETQKHVIEKTGETGNKLEENRQLVKDWLKCQPHLPETYDDRILGIFLRSCKHDLKRVHTKLDNYFTVRTVYPDLFADRDPYDDGTQRALDNFNVVPLPLVTPDGYRITLHKFVTTDASQFEPRQLFRAMFMIGDIRLVEEPPIAGDIFLFDVKNMTAAHVAKLAHPVLKSTLFCVQNAYPQRLREIHLFNAPPLIDRVVTLFKQFLKEKMRNRFHIHTSHDTLWDFVPRSHLPSDYGGDLKSTQHLQATWNKKLKAYKPYFEEQSGVRADESRRHRGADGTGGGLFGCEGAFRKLNID